MPATRRVPLIALPLLALPLLGLAACDQAADSAAPVEKRAAGEVLGGTISDDMIPLDQLRSQSPPMRVVPSENGGETAADAENAEPVSEAASPEPDASAEDSAPSEPSNDDS